MLNIEEKLIKHHKKSARFSSHKSNYENITPEGVRRLFINLIKTSSKDVIFDPVCGLGTTLLEFSKRFRTTNLIGVDVNSKVIDTAKAFSEKNKLNVNFLNSNILTDKLNLPKADLLIADPPFGLKAGKDIGKNFEIFSSDGTVLFIQKFLELTKNTGNIIVVVPEGFLFNSTNAHKEVRKMVSGKHHLSAVIGLPISTFKPFSAVKPSMLVISKKKSTKPVFFTKISDINNKREIDSVINDFRNRKRINENSLWIEYKKINNVWSYNFYDPGLKQFTEKLKKENTKALSELVQISKSRKEIKSKKTGLIIKTKDFKYPLDIASLSKNTITTVLLKRGDVLMSESFSGETKYYLFDHKGSENIYASTFLAVLRVESAKINPEYLYLFLQSEVIKKYLKFYQVGVYFPRLRLEDLKNLPIIIPEKLTIQKSKNLFRTHISSIARPSIQDINKEIFDTRKPKKPVQSEFLLKELEELKIWKREIIERILKDDLKELMLSKNNELYKSFLILSGSLLEAFLLDWISEIENKDYFSSESEQLTLGRIIWKKLKNAIPDIDKKLLDKAENIRKKRNLIHPREYFNYDVLIDEKTCDDIIKDLRYIFNERKSL